MRKSSCAFEVFREGLARAGTARRLARGRAPDMAGAGTRPPAGRKALRAAPLQRGRARWISGPRPSSRLVLPKRPSCSSVSPSRDGRVTSAPGQRSSTASPTRWARSRSPCGCCPRRRRSAGRRRRSPGPPASTPSTARSSGCAPMASGGRPSAGRSVCNRSVPVAAAVASTCSQTNHVGKIGAVTLAGIPSRKVAAARRARYARCCAAPRRRSRVPAPASVGRVRPVAI
jgi:hypothetical protein